MGLLIRIVLVFLANFGGLWLADYFVPNFLFIDTPISLLFISAGVLTVVNIIFWPVFKLALSPVLILGLAFGVILVSSSFFTIDLPMVLLITVVVFVFVAFFLRIILLNLGVGLVLLNALAILLLEIFVGNIEVSGLLPLFYASLILGLANGLATLLAKSARG